MNVPAYIDWAQYRDLYEEVEAPAGTVLLEESKISLHLCYNKKQTR